jgi:hypothetical protein
MLENFVLPVAQWYCYEGLYSTYYEQHRTLRFLFVRGLTALRWSVGWAWRTKQKKGLQQVSILLHFFRFVMVNEEA